MVATKSTMLELGSSAADFCLPDVSNSNKQIQLADFQGQPLLIMFICNHCPFVVHIVDRLTELANNFQSRGVGVVAISSNDVEHYPQDGPSKMQDFAADAGFKFPYLYDQDQYVAKNYSAACTPDFFLFDQNHKLFYRGQMDGSRPSNNVPVTGSDLISALEAVIGNRPAPERQIPSLGCNIKWRPGNEPAYF